MPASARLTRGAPLAHPGLKLVITNCPIYNRMDSKKGRMIMKQAIMMNPDARIQGCPYPMLVPGD